MVIYSLKENKNFNLKFQSKIDFFFLISKNLIKEKLRNIFFYKNFFKN